MYNITIKKVVDLFNFLCYNYCDKKGLLCVDIVFGTFLAIYIIVFVCIFDYLEVRIS